MAYDAAEHAAKGRQIRQELDDLIAIERLRQHIELASQSGYPVPQWIFDAADVARDRIRKS